MNTIPNTLKEHIFQHQFYSLKVERIHSPQLRYSTSRLYGLKVERARCPHSTGIPAATSLRHEGPGKGLVSHSHCWLGLSLRHGDITSVGNSALSDASAHSPLVTWYNCFRSCTWERLQRASIRADPAREKQLVRCV